MEFAATHVINYLLTDCSLHICIGRKKVFNTGTSPLMANADQLSYFKTMLDL